MTAHASVLCAADDIQQIKLGNLTFYVPKAWTRTGIIVADTKSKVTTSPWPQTIETKRVGFIPRADWQPYGSDELPGFIDISYGAGFPSGNVPLDTVTKQWLDIEASRPADSNGFVRVVASAAKEGETPRYEVFVYKGYRNALGQPLIIKAENWDYPLGNRAPSNVTIRAQPHLSLSYRFDDRKFPESTWWPLYQRTLAFLDYLQKPK